MIDLYLIHGLSAPRWEVRPLGRMLEKYGYKPFASLPVQGT